MSIDNASTQAVDDAISITQLSENVYRVRIHIADVASLVKPESAIDLEAKKRACSTYVMNTFYLPMLPKDLNSDICSILEEQPRLSIALNIDINDRGIVDFNSMSYDLALIKNKMKLSYDLADKLIKASDPENLLLSEKYPKELEL